MLYKICVLVQQFGSLRIILQYCGGEPYENDLLHLIQVRAVHILSINCCLLTARFVCIFCGILPVFWCVVSWIWWFRNNWNRSTAKTSIMRSEYTIIFIAYTFLNDIKHLMDDDFICARIVLEYFVIMESFKYLIYIISYYVFLNDAIIDIKTG